jgi:methyl-accepting chemotaxis protein
MLGFGKTSACNERLLVAALSRSLALVTFDATGNILSANENFCTALGYSEAEIVGKHHSIFVDPEYARSGAYKDFWVKLGGGAHDAGEYKRIGKGGHSVYIQGTYNPILDARGKVLQVVKVATDITATKLLSAEFESKMTAISLVQAVIEFTPAGEVITANEMFLKTLGYSLEEIKGKHHRLFVDSAYASSPQYVEFWRMLNAGKPVSNSFKRVGKGGKIVWIQASYNPIFDLDGKVSKVVKFANDITDLTYLGEGMARLAAKDVERGIDVPFAPAFDQLRLDFNAALSNLRATVGGVKESVSAVARGSKEIEGASDDLARRTEQQAASLEETAAALDQVTATVRTSAEGAGKARAAVAEAHADAEESGKVVRNATEAMGRIETSSREIGQIIGVIDEIAFQTNLLALNAGVEAARAGDAGRGFAVVASEVRGLAQRSAEAAKQIKGLVATSFREVETGARLVAETGASLVRIAESVGNINSLFEGMVAGTDEQSKALQEVNSAVNHMDQTTQQNAAMAEQATAACRSMSSEIERLTDMVCVFKTGSETDTGALRHERQKVAPHVFRDPRKQVSMDVAPVLAATNRRPAKIAVAAENVAWNEF